MGSFADAESQRRIYNSLLLAVVSEVHKKTVHVRVKIGVDEDGNEVQSGWLPWMTRRETDPPLWWPPQKGEQVVVGCPGGDLTQGIVLGALYRDRHPNQKDEEEDEGGGEQSGGGGFTLP